MSVIREFSSQALSRKESPEVVLRKRILYLEYLLEETTQPFAFTKDSTLFTRINEALKEKM